MSRETNGGGKEKGNDLAVNLFLYFRIGIWDCGAPDQEAYPRDEEDKENKKENNIENNKENKSGDEKENSDSNNDLCIYAPHRYIHFRFSLFYF